MALDREFMVKSVLTPGYVPAYSMVPPGIDNYDVAAAACGMGRPCRARSASQKPSVFWKRPDYGPDNPLAFEFIHRSTDDNPKVAPVAQANWAEIAPWVKPTIVKQDTKVLYARLRQSDFQVADGAWVADFDDPINFLYLLKSDTGQQNYGNYNNPEYDALLHALECRTRPEEAGRDVRRSRRPDAERLSDHADVVPGDQEPRGSGADRVIRTMRRTSTARASCARMVSKPAE
jgi:ABC-type oligopeptide transport system substrate-binding subunit